MSEKDVAIVDLENALIFAKSHAGLYERVKAIAEHGVKDSDEAKVLIAMLRDFYE